MEKLFPFLFSRVRQVQCKGASGAGETLQRHPSTVNLGDLLHHGKAQSRPPITAPGRINLVEALPDLIPLILWDTRSLIPHGETDLSCFPAQCYPHSAARSAIFEGIIQQILEEAGEQGLIRLSCDMLWNVQDQGLLPLPLLTAQGPNKLR